MVAVRAITRFYAVSASGAIFRKRASFFPLEPNRNLARKFTGLHVHHARPAADRAVFGIGLLLAASEVDIQLLGLPAKWAHDCGAGALLLVLQSERKNVIKSARSSAESSSGFPCAVPPHTPKR